MRYIISITLVVALAAANNGAAQLARRNTHPFDQSPQPWKRLNQPILSAHTTKQTWCRVVVYSPHVIFHDGKYRMWYLGTSTGSRAGDIALGYAESNDGIHWKEHPKNPILTGEHIPWGRFLQTPFVLFDAGKYKMWFVSGDGVRRDEKGRIKSNDQRLGYAISDDGVAWKVHPKPIFPSARSPSVMKENGRYRMWMNSRPDVKDKASSSIYQNIYAFRSNDGVQWSRSEKPAIRPSGQARSVVYPFVLNEDNQYYMWYGCHVPGGRFEIHCATSKDGSHWKIDHERPAFPARRKSGYFDSRYTSTPCVVRAKDRYLLYYSARDEKNEYIDGKGRKQRDGSGVYAHIGVAEIQK